jgi:hypothetical protein
MNNPPAKAAPAADIMESVLIKGDLARLTPAERVTYYNAVCKSIGLNPLTQPLAYMNLQGRLQLYAKRDAADQLRRLRNVSIEIVSQGLTDDLYSVHVQARDATGRQDEDLGVVPLPANVKGEFRANMILKAVTKAKRRVTLSICGLGFLDETEVESIPDAKIEPAPSAEQLEAIESGGEAPAIFASNEHADAARSASGSAAAGAQSGPSPPGAAPAVNPPGVNVAAPQSQLSVEDMAREAASFGPDVLRKFFNSRTSDEKKRLRKIEAELVKLYPPINGD